ncbi:ABC transporter permease [Dethiosulfatarculus sandiegensis]|uniref:ABC transporter permease n=1 Tax=Dethiosulfatarculus sandiegensis TaxID=1429043 RepID=A0A0D2J9V6_9BACT|nr:FtsX-like permease family protein [Dethiosulfatarculus sandiegensis]KIX12456.1 hypothetical protein X474_19175 [Dethiosulfatarculus sandiegensis]
MTAWLKMAFRNIFRNKRRSLVTLLAISLGLSAVSLFKGYTDHTYQGLRQAAIRGEGLGHLVVYKKGFNALGSLEPEKYLLSKDEMQKIAELAGQDERVVLATPQLYISGLVSDGRISRIFLGKGVVPEDERTIRGGMAAMYPVKGKTMTNRVPYGVELSQDLARQLKFKPGSEGVVMGATFEGQMNALDFVARGVFDTGQDATNDKYIRVPFAFAQSLYDTNQADRMVILLQNWQQTEAVEQKLEIAFKQAGLNLEMRTWHDLSVFFQKVKGMFDSMFLFIFIIVFVVVVMSVVNTMGMAVMERTREIGALRSLGLKKRGVSLLFALEGALLGLMGSLLGVVITVFVWAMILVWEPTYIPPGISSPVPLLVNLLPIPMLRFSGIMICLSLLASIIPAKRAAGQKVVEALGHV